MKRDSFILRVILFVAMSALFFLFLKITERKIPQGVAPDTTYERSAADTTRPAVK
ncbi:MAG TPA: hypothetical protein VFD13_00385 [Candidatus Kapabacteria bacterium]|nr:hypothetical protein [Candidatus Kapabacteria bacterium]